MSAVLRRTLRSPAAVDAGTAVAVAIVGYVEAHRYLSTFSVVPWIEDLLVPCTGRPGWIPAPDILKALPAWQAFLARQVEYFPCQALDGVPLVEVGAAWQQSEYFHRLLGAWFWLVGPTIDGFVTFQSMFHGATCGVAYLTFRLGLWRITSVACAAGLVWSSWHLTAVAMPIEYAKGPWVIAVVGLCGLLLRRDAGGQAVWPPALALGLATGIGMGFKTDLMAAVPLALFTAAVFVRRVPSGPSRKLVATCCVLAGITVGSGWVMYRAVGVDRGSVLAVQFLGGMDWQTEATYAVSPNYDYGLAFDDSHITVLINTYANRVMGMAEPVHFYSRAMQDASVSLLRDLWTTFPGDLILRTIAATLRVIQLNGYGLPIAVAGLFVVLVRDLRAGWFVTFAVVYLSVYVSVVFQRRHFYHLEFISWGLAGVFAQALCMPHRVLSTRPGVGSASPGITRRLVLAGLSLAIVAGGGLVALTVARQFQQAAMIRLLEQYTQATREQHDLSRVQQSSGETLVRIAGISAAADAAGHADEMRGDYAVITFGCRDDQPLRVASRYLPAGVSWDRSFQVDCRGPGTTSTLMLPVYQYGSTWQFDGVMMSPTAVASLQTISAMPGNAGIGLWLPIQVSADWRNQSWFKTMRSPLETP